MRCAVSVSSAFSLTHAPLHTASLGQLPCIVENVPEEQVNVLRIGLVENLGLHTYIIICILLCIFLFKHSGLAYLVSTKDWAHLLEPGSFSQGIGNVLWLEPLAPSWL